MDSPIYKRIIALLIVTLVFTACFKETALTGMFVSYKSVNLRFEQSVAWNSNHHFKVIDVPNDDYTLLSMGDSHVGSTINLDRFFNIARTTNVSAVVMVGDLTNGHAGDYTLFQQHLPDKDTLITFPIVGNHDLHYEGWNEFYTRFGSSTYLFTVKTTVATDLCICLDNAGGTLGDKQLAWLTQLLENTRPDYRHCIIFTHDNFFRFRYTDSTNPLVEELQVLMELFTRYRVDMVITGHDHIHNAKLFGNTWYLTMDALEDGLSNAGYLKLNVKNDGMLFAFEYLN